MIDQQGFLYLRLVYSNIGAVCVCDIFLLCAPISRESIRHSFKMMKFCCPNVRMIKSAICQLHKNMGHEIFYNYNSNVIFKADFHV